MTRNINLSQYADDTLFLLDGTSKSLNATLDVLYDYSHFSGLKVNFEKTHAVWIGIKKYSTASIKTRWKLSWGKTDFKLLGISFHIDLDKMQQINFKEKVQKIRSLIKLWKRRYLTPLGKITVIKTLLLPMLNHLFISIPNPDEQTIKEINNIFFEFLWDGPAKIKQNVVIKQYCEGGLKMVNLKAFIISMKLTWLRRVIISNSPWLLNKNVNLTFVEELFIFNIGNTYSSADLHIFIIVKYYIYATKRLDHPLSVAALQNKVKYFYKLMQHTATRNGNLDKFEKAWTKYKDVIDTMI